MEFQDLSSLLYAGFIPYSLGSSTQYTSFVVGWCCRIEFDTHSRQRSILYSVSAAFMSRDVDLQTFLFADEDTSCRVCNCTVTVIAGSVAFSTLFSPQQRSCQATWICKHPHVCRRRHPQAMYPPAIHQLYCWMVLLHKIRQPYPAAWHSLSYSVFSSAHVKVT